MAAPFPGFPQSSDQLTSFLEINLSRFTRHASYVLGDPDDAEDVVQETIIRAYGMRESLKTITNPAAYMFRMVSNAALDMRRRKNARENAMTGMLQASIAGFSLSREEDLIREEERFWVRSLLDRLPDEQAAVIRFRFADELSFAEIAEIIEVPVATVKSRFSYGMVKLKSMVDKHKEVTNAM
ncbi:MAG: RNA polymerase sigma factor [Bacteroidetes bacterium]|nr:RNA polymerase sigma factor [Bacteroidota bacterium]